MELHEVKEIRSWFIIFGLCGLLATAVVGGLAHSVGYNKGYSQGSYDNSLSNRDTLTLEDLVTLDTPLPTLEEANQVVLTPEEMEADARHKLNILKERADVE